MKGRAAKKTAKTAPAREPDANHIKAAKDFERVVKLFHQNKLSEAEEKILALMEAYPQEAQIRDRARLYLRACESRQAQQITPPTRPGDIYYRAVLLTNNGETDQAISLLEGAQGQTPKDDRLVYLLAVNHLRKGARQNSMALLREAIRLQEVNRNLARNDPEFEDIREDSDFLEVVSKES
jgi:tetratricopeptide (TPR) repeat protein